MARFLIALISILFFVVLSENSIIANADSVKEDNVRILAEATTRQQNQPTMANGTQLRTQKPTCRDATADMQLADVQCGSTQYTCPDDRPKCCFDANYNSYYCCQSDQNCCIDNDGSYRCCSRN